MSKKGKDGGRFVLRLEYGWGEMEAVERAVNEVVNGIEEVNLLEQETADGNASTVLGRFVSKSLARRVGASIQGKLGEKTSNKVDLRIREGR